MCFLTIHTKTEHDCLPRVACNCGKFLGSTKAILYHYNSHVKNNLTYRCLQCDKCYKTEMHFHNHINSVHGEGKEKKLSCLECGKTFKEARHLAVHQNSHLPDELKFTHTCRFCSKKYSSVFSLRQHIKHIHINVMRASLKYFVGNFSPCPDYSRTRRSNVSTVTRCSPEKPTLTPT
jgi:Zinc finger, C2H2 type